jgi:hypothetical protein
MMKRIIEFLLHGCFHKWVIHEERTVLDDDDVIIGKKFIMRCEKCGDMKFFKGYD